MSTQRATFQVKGTEPQALLFRGCRRMIVGPWVNQPDHYEGYNGFVGWAGVARLSSGRWLLTFSSGYWHFSPALTPEILRRQASRAQFEKWHRESGMPSLSAPRGGRAHILSSDDEGKSWSRPKTLVDTEQDDRHPTVLEAEDGSLLCTFFTGALPYAFESWFMRSSDAGKTWSTPQAFPERSRGGFGNGSAIRLRSGRILCSVGGFYEHGAAGGAQDLNLCASDDQGRSFFVLAAIHGKAEIAESSLCELEDGRLLLISRREGPVAWSEDGGRNWSDQVSFGLELFDPHLLLFPNGVLACFHGSYNGGGLRVLLSPDGGATWHGPKDRVGYAVDPSVYGYCHPMLLPDGSAYLVYPHTGGHRPHDARTGAIWGLRVRPFNDASGIEILPAPGSPQDLGLPCHELEGLHLYRGEA